MSHGGIHSPRRALLWCVSPTQLGPTLERKNMTNKPRHRQHAIDYIEFTVPDIAVAKEFYGRVFGWQFNDYGPGYAGIKGEHREMGGFAKGETAPGGALVVLFSEQLDDTLTAVRSAGGRIIKEPFAFPGGRRFHFADPSGNELAVWTPSAESDSLAT